MIKNVLSAEYACLVSHNERVLTVRNRPVNVADGDIVRVWYSVPTHQSSNNTVMNIMQENDESGVDVETNNMHTTNHSVGSTPTPQYLPGTMHHCILWVGWALLRLWRLLKIIWPQRKRGRGRRRRHGSHYHDTTTWKPCCSAGRWSWLLCTTLLASTSAFSLKGSTRFGEAQHPGPRFWIGTANPSGTVGKERQLAELPEGIWGITETHLSGVNQKATIRKIQHEARAQGRDLQCVPGAPLPIRARSSSAGTWSGVLTLSDWTSKPVTCLWPNGEHNIGRVQVVQSFYGPFSLMGATMYGWPKSPTWPNALRDTNLLFDNLVQELGLSRGGPRYIVGDFNHDLDALRGWEVLQHAGWKDAQDLAYEWWGQEHCMTYRSSSITDHVLLSPEMVPLVKDVKCWNWFADHSGIGACLEVPIVKLQQRVWPLPAEVPWDAVRYEEWRQAQHHLPDVQASCPDHRVLQWARAYENSFDGFMDTSIGHLPTSCRGRCQQKDPVVRAVDSPLLKPSRPGEVQIKTDFVGRAVHRWFQQLRRLQSMVHAKNADKNTPDAIEYRTSLWRAIRKSKGFEGTFETWWRTRPTQLAGLPEELPSEPPTAASCRAIFEDFHINYRNFESWHARRRKNLISAQFQANTNKIFEVTRKEPRGGVNYLEKATNTTVLGSNAAQSQIHVDINHELQLLASLKVLEQMIPISAQEGQVITLEGEWILQDGMEAEVIEHASTADKLHQQLIEFWKPRWWKDPLPKPEEWSRIINFAKAYLPPGHLEHVDISVESWTDINRRYGPRAARGPDGLSHADLRKMPSQFQDELVSILNQCEEETVWPEVWRTGFVHSLEKKEGASRVNEYRPVIIYSVIYRSWGSLRAKRFLQHLAHLVDERQLGFMPGKEVAEIWMLLQGLVERSVQEGEDLMGFVTDIEKAFESLPRDPIFEIAHHLGLPAKTMQLWKHFLDTTERRFLVRGEVSDAVFSNHCFPEGCSLSCVALSIAGLTLHSYMNEFSKRCGTISYVDNLELLARALGPLQQGVLTMQTWTEMWKLELDQEKSYIWTSEAGTRKEAKMLGWNVVRSAKDLGAQLNYGRSRSVKSQTQRFTSLDSIWPKLRRCLAPNWQKQRLLRQALWPKAFYGVSICTIGWAHIKSLRTEAMKALGYQMAGAAPGLRLGLLCHEQCDPGFYQAWHVLTTFRRIARKRPSFAQMWKDYMDRFDGGMKQGPFAKLLEVCQQLRWTIDAPRVADADGCWHLWLEMDEKVLYELVKDAWTWKVFLEVQKRKDLEGLQGIDRRVILQAHARVRPHFLHSIWRLQDGSFVEPAQHVKYDLSKTPTCTLCGAPDSMEHRCTTCPRRQHVYAKHHGILQKWTTFSKAKQIHLLPSQNPYWIPCKQKAMQMEDQWNRSQIHPEPELCHLFTDGSCHGGRHRLYQLAAWAVVSATNDCCVANGVLGGLGQDNDRAELRAVIAAVQYAIEMQKNTVIWTDSTFAAEGMVRLLHDAADLPEGHCGEDRVELQGLLCHGEVQLQIHHVPGHAKWVNQDFDFDNWAARWNDRADREANMAMKLHGDELLCLHRQLCAHHERELSEVCALQDLHLDIMEKTAQDQDEEDQLARGEEGSYDLWVGRGCPASLSPFADLPLGDDARFATLLDSFGQVFVLNFLQVIRR